MSSYSKQYYQEKQKSSLQSAQEVVPLVLELIQPLNVIDIGCGIGIWLSVFKEHGVEEVVSRGKDTSVSAVRPRRGHPPIVEDLRVLVLER